MTIANRVGAGFATVMLTCGIFLPAKADVMKELVPTGKLRVAIAVAPAPSALYAVKDDTTGEYRGVTVEFGSATGKETRRAGGILATSCLRRDSKFGGERQVGCHLYAG